MKNYRKQFVSLGACALLVFGFSTNVARAAFGTINNDAWLRSTDGQPIFAHSGYLAKFGNTYYLYGQEYVGSTQYYQSGTVNGTNGANFVGTNVYTSTDLIHWTPKVVAFNGGGYITGTDWGGRCWGVLYNAPTNKYVMWMKYNGVNGLGGLCLTSNSPLGPFTVDNLQTSVGNVFSTPPIPGDSKFFYAADGTPYLACSDSHGRARAYVAPLSSDYKTVNAVVQIALWGADGQEGDTAFYVPATGRYYFFTSETNGWSYSFAYQVSSTSLMSGYSADAVLSGSQPSNTYWAQTLQAIGIQGTSGTVNMLLCDRWGLFNSNYASAGHGVGYNVWEPLTISGANVTFNALQTWQLDAAAGTWQQNVPSGTPPTYVASGAAASGTGTIAPALPAGLQTNDILLLFVETANQAVSVSNQNGGTWAAVNTPGGTGTAGGSDGARLTTFWSRYNGSQGAPTVSDSGDHQLARIIAIRGAAAAGNPWNVATNSDVDTFTDTGAWILGGTTTVDNTLVVVASAGATPDADGTANFSAWTNGNLTNLTERVDNTTSQGNGGSLGIATGVKDFAGDYGVTTALHATAGKKGLISIAIKQ